MRPFRVAAVCCALGFLGAGATPLQAAWNNVFQVCCRGCRGAAPAPAPVVANYRPVVAYSSPGCDPCPKVCTTQYVQRCYYQPVVSYQARTYYEAVTTYRTSYYYEPVTSLRYSFYRDPCTGCCQQVATPVTCLRLRSQCCPVTSYLQRCALVPVTTYQQAFYYEPVTTCCRPACPAPCDPCAGTPGVIERPTTPNGSSGTPGLRQYNDTMPPAGTSSRQLPPEAPRLSAPVRPGQTPPAVKLERIVALPPHEVEGIIVRDDKTPQANVRVKLISADQQGAERTVMANANGEFRVTLASGGWLVYVEQADGKLDFVRKIEVRNDEPKQFTLVSR